MNYKAMIPFLDEEELKQLAQKVAESPDGNYQGVTYSNLLPFLDEDDVDMLMLSFYRKGQDLCHFYPFASDEGFSRLVDEIVKNGNPSIDLRGLFPFLEDEDLTKLLNFILAQGGSFGGVDGNDLLPFLDDDDIDKLFIAQVKNHDPRAKKTVAFASEDALHELVKEYVSHPEADLELDEFYPFMDEDDVRTLFKANLERN